MQGRCRGDIGEMRAGLHVEQGALHLRRVRVRVRVRARARDRGRG